MSNAKHLSAIEAELEELGEAPLTATELEMLQQASPAFAGSEPVDGAGDREVEFNYGVDEHFSELFNAEAAHRFGRRRRLDEHERISKIAAHLAGQSKSDAAAEGSGTSGAKLLFFPVQRPAAYLSVAGSVAAAVVLFWALRPGVLETPGAKLGSQGHHPDAVGSGVVLLGEQARRSLAILEQMSVKQRGAERGPSEPTLEARRSRWARLLAMRVSEHSPVSENERERR